MSADLDPGCIIALFVVGVLAFGLIALAIQANEKSNVSLDPEDIEARRLGLAERSERLAQLRDGSGNPALVCPHCQTKGKVRVKPIKHKAGVSGTKATAAVLTAGISILATGLSRKENMTQAKCGNCGSVWRF